MSANATTAAPTERKKLAQGKDAAPAADAALGHDSQNTLSPEGAKEGDMLPSGWRWVNLPELGELSRGKSKHRPRNEPKLYGGPYPFVQTGDIRESGGTIRQHTQTYSELGLAQSRLWPTGTLCITIAANIGETGILTYPACFPDSVVGFSHDGDPVTVRFVELFFRIAKSELDRLAPATAQKNINVDILSKLRIPFPPLPEQRRIVAEIEKQFTRLEAGVAALRRVQANLKRYRVAVLKAACEGKLVPTEAELHRVTAASRRSAAGKQSRDGSATFETGAELLTRILAERRKNWTGRGKYKEPAAPDLSAVASAKGDTANLPPLPEGWTWATFGQLCRIQGGFAFKSSDYAKEGIPLVRISNLVNGRVQVAEDTVFLPQSFADANPDFLLRKGDVLIAMSGATAGKMATMEHELPALLNQRIGRFVLSAAELSNSKFISLLVQQIGAKVLKDAYGAAQPNISPSEIEEMPVPLPPLAEQTRIVAEVERRLSVVEELVSVVSANLQRAVRLRQSILHKAFTGEL